MSAAPQRPLFALALRLASAAAMATVFMLVKLAAGSGVSLPEIMFWRQAISVPILVMVAGASAGGLAQLRSQRLKSHFGRATTGMIGMSFNFGAPILLPLAVSTIFGFTTPLFAVILGAIFLREHVGPWRWAAVALGFLGVLLIAQPHAMPIAPLGAAVGLGSGFMIAIVSIQIRDLGRTEPPITTVFWFSTFGTLLAAPVLPFVFHSHTAAQWAMLLALGAVATLGQLLLTAALRYGAVASVVVMDYSALVWTTLYGEWIFRQPPPASTWLGAPLIITAGLLIAWREHRMSKAPMPTLAAELS